MPSEPGQRAYRFEQRNRLAEEPHEWDEKELARAKRRIEQLEHQVQSWERRAEVARRVLSDEVNDRKPR